MFGGLFNVNLKAIVNQYATRNNVDWILSETNVSTLTALIRTLLDDDKKKTSILYNGLKKYFKEEKEKDEDL